KELPSPREIGKSNYSLSTHLFDRKGKLLYEIYREQNRTPVKLDQLPVFITQATIAIEDKDFYLHKGVAVSGGILRAAKEIIFNNSLQGGSTITQQLVKTALLSPERTIKRKIKEIILALWAEKIYSKNRILEMYLNQVPYGGAAHGIEEAAKVYFGVHARDLTLEQAALLAGLPQAPSLYSPYVNPALAQKRRNEVLRSMQSQGFISQTVSNKLQSTKLEVVPPRTNIKAPHFVFYVKSQLEEKYGIRQVEEGGLNVITTLDLDIQEEAEKILKEELEKVKELNVSNGAILVTRPSTGEILAMVGSVDYFASPSGAFNVTTALRQPGSSIKPIMYSLALEKEYTAASIINDTAIIFNIPGSTPYRPVNYDGKTHGNVPLRYALANSFNISAVRVLNTIGVNNFINHAKKMGISTWTDSNRFGLSLTLGGGEVTMIDMAKAFGVFANEGNRVNLTSFNRIVTSSDNLFYQYSPMSVKVIDAGNAFIINDILSDNFARRWAFGSNSALEINGFKVAVKTGTTDEKKDNWTIGYTPDYIVAVWVGNNNNQPMNPYLASGITGAAPIWNRMMSFLLKNYGIKSQFIEPENIVEKICYFGKMEYFVKGTEIKASCRDNLFGATPSPTP
ncbi:penicillin-binding protein, partial [Candidatus Roizmanbacteria bacterium CG22_combo_CG10-13_8_21_14_all_33_16]